MSHSATRPKSEPRTPLGVRALRADSELAVLALSRREQARSGRASIAEDEKDLFDRFPDPLPHLDIGDVKYSDGKFRFLLDLRRVLSDRGASAPAPPPAAPAASAPAAAA